METYDGGVSMIVSFGTLETTIGDDISFAPKRELHTGVCTPLVFFGNSQVLFLAMGTVESQPELAGLETGR